MARRIVAEFDAVTGPFLQKLNRIDSSINRFERGTLTSFNRVERGVNALVGTASRLRTFTGILATGFGVNLATKFVDQAALIRNALREAGDTSEETFDKVFQSSVRALSGFKDTAQGVQRFQKALGDRQGIQESIRQLETLNKLLALSGKTTQERSSTFIQFSQALQAGYLGGEELRAIRENAPIELTREIAKQAGGTIKDLKKLAEAGKLTTDVMVAALKELEDEADKRFKKINVTIQDAATVFASGAIVAVEGFDKGLGASKATITGLNQLGVALGRSGDAFETFGKAIQVAGAVLITSFGARRVSGIVTGLKDMSKARLEAAKAADAEFVSSSKALAVSKARFSQANTNLATLTAQGAAEGKLTAARAANAKALTGLTAAQTRHTAATAASVAAQNSLLLSSRLATGAMATLRGALAFMGGWPGLILSAAVAFTVLYEKAETTAEKLKRLKFSGGELEGATGNLRSAFEELSDALKGTGDAAVDSTAKLAAAAKQGVATAREALRAAKALEQQTQAERGRTLIDLKANLEDLDRREAATKEIVTPTPDRPQILRNITAEFNERRVELKRQVAALEEDIRQATIRIHDATVAIGEATVPDGPLGPTDEDIKSWTDAKEASEKFYDQQLTDAEQQKKTLADMAALREKLIAGYGEESDEVQNLDEAVRRYKATISQAAIETRDTDAAFADLTRSATALRAALDAIGTVDVSLKDRVAIARRQLDLARSGASEIDVEAAGNAMETFARLGTIGREVDPELAEQIKSVAKEDATLNSELSKTTELIDKIFNPAKGGGGGKSDEVELLKDAKALIESQFTAQERLNDEIAKAKALRDQVAATYPKEIALISAMDEAISRLQDEYENLQDVNDEFWSSLSQQIANSITEWTNFGDFVRNVLADLVRQFGPTFFQALFTPGQQKGTDLGTTLGNTVTKLFHDGGRSGRRRTVSKAAFIGAPRLHGGLGLKSDEFTAILQKGERVIPKGLNSGMGGSANFVFNNDFRNADPSMRPWIEAKLMQQRAEFESRWIKTARKVNTSRIKV